MSVVHELATGAACRVSRVPHEGDVLRAFRLRLQPPDRLRGPPVLRARDVSRHGRVCVGARGQGMGLPARVRDSLRHGVFRVARPRHRLARDPPAGHLLCDDHARARADGVFLLLAGAVHSPFGQVLKAIRENEPRALSLGYEVNRHKLLAYVLSGTLAGLAGATKVLVFELASLTDVHWTMSGEVVLMVLLGGLGTVFGPVVGALIIISMENYLAQIGSWVTVVQGVIFVICVLTFRRGVIGELGRLIRKPL